MRKVELSAPGPIPSKALQWALLRDYLRAEWTGMARAPFSGAVQIGYDWRVVGALPDWRRHVKIWPEIVHAVSGCCINGATPQVGPCRFTSAPEAQLIVTMEEGI